MKKRLLVVGDGYETFAKLDGIMTETALRRALTDDGMSVTCGGVVFGQGVSSVTRDVLSTVLQAREIQCYGTEELAPLCLTHKRDRENVLISTPTRLGTKRYAYRVFIDEQEDRLSDHVTGQHVGAMPLMEAARQAAIATIECEFLADEGTKWGFILSRFSSSFENYVFPLPIELIATLRDFDHSDANVQMEVTLEFYQVNAKICDMRIEGSIHKALFLEKIENRRARKIVDQFHRTHTEDDATEVDLKTA